MFFVPFYWKKSLLTLLQIFPSLSFADPSYQAAKARILKGDLGQPFLVKSATVDMYDDLFLNYSLKSGGIWTDW